MALPAAMSASVSGSDVFMVCEDSTLERGLPGGGARKGNLRTRGSPLW
jgi:hypothetical protein